LEQYENNSSSSSSVVRPTSRSLRPLSRSTVTSSGSVRKGAQSNRLEQYDNTSAAAGRPVKVGTTDLESSGQFSAAGVFSPPSSAVRRRKRSETVNKLEVVETDTVCSTPDASTNTSTSNSIRRRSLNSRSSVKQQIESLGKLEVMESETSGSADDRKNTGVTSRQPMKKIDTILLSNLEHRAQTRRVKVSNENATTASVNYDSKIDQKHSDHTRLLHRNAGSLSKISQKIDDTPSMLDLSIMKFNGEVKLKRLDSFDRLSKRIITQQQSTSPTKMIKVMKDSRRTSLVVGGGK
jgi:hypothetical protein